MSSHVFLTIIAFTISTIATLWLVPFVIKWHKQKKLVVTDMNKLDKRRIPGLGGIALLLSFFFALSGIISLKMLFNIDGIDLRLMLPGILSIIIMAFVGITDDILMFPIRPIKPVLALLASIPMMTIAYGRGSVFDVPLIGEIDLGFIYPLVIVPLIVVFVSNAINIMADFDGLTPGNGLIISITLFICAYLANQPAAMVIFAAIIGSLLIFYFYNKYPAKIFTGNVGTLFVGSAIAVGAVLGNLKYPLLILMIPYALHLILQQRITWDRKTIKTRPRERGIIDRQGRLRSEYTRPYGLTHLIMQKMKAVTEKKLVYTLMGIEFACAAIAIIFHSINLHR